MPAALYNFPPKNPDNGDFHFGAVFYVRREVMRIDCTSNTLGRSHCTVFQYRVLTGTPYQALSLMCLVFYRREAAAHPPVAETLRSKKQTYLTNVRSTSMTAR